MKGYKLPFTDRFGNDLHEGDIFKYTTHKGYFLPTFLAKIVWIEQQVAFGYQIKTVYRSAVSYTIFAFNSHDELETDFIRHIEKI